MSRSGGSSSRQLKAKEAQARAREGVGGHQEHGRVRVGNKGMVTGRGPEAKVGREMRTREHTEKDEQRRRTKSKKEKKIKERKENCARGWVAE